MKTPQLLPLLLLPAMASGQAVSNPDFENGTFNFPGNSSPEFQEGPIFDNWTQSNGGSSVYAVSGGPTSGPVSLMLRETASVSQLFNFNAAGDYEFTLDGYVFEDDNGSTGVTVEVTQTVNGSSALNSTFIAEFNGATPMTVVPLSSTFNVPATGQYEVKLTGAVGAIGLDSVAFTPVPEPSGAVLSLVSLGMLAARRKRS